MRPCHKIIIINLNEYRILFSACIGFITIAVMKYSVRAREGRKCSFSPQFQAAGCHGRAVMVIGQSTLQGNHHEGVVKIKSLRELATLFLPSENIEREMCVC